MMRVRPSRALLAAGIALICGAALSPVVARFYARTLPLAYESNVRFAITGLSEEEFGPWLQRAEIWNDRGPKVTWFGFPVQVLVFGEGPQPEIAVSNAVFWSHRLSNGLAFEKLVTGKWIGPPSPPQVFRPDQKRVKRAGLLGSVLCAGLGIVAIIAAIGIDLRQPEIPA